MQCCRQGRWGAVEGLERGGQGEVRGRVQRDEGEVRQGVRSVEGGQRWGPRARRGQDAAREAAPRRGLWEGRLHREGPRDPGQEQPQGPTGDAAAVLLERDIADKAEKAGIT